MVKLIESIVKHYKSVVLYTRCRQAIKRADRQAIITGKKQLVIMYDSKPLVVNKQHLKRLIKERTFIKGFTPEKAESLVIYKTY